MVAQEAEMAAASSDCPPEVMNAEDVMYILYTSGSTGAPKGVAHSTAGYLVYAGFTQKHVFGYYDQNDVFGCVADIGWITGNTILHIVQIQRLGYENNFRRNQRLP